MKNHRLMSMQMGRFYLKITLIVTLSLPVLDYPSFAEPPDEASIRARVQSLIEFLDSSQYKREVTWDEHVVLCYQLALQRAPSNFEYYMMNALRRNIKLPRSAVVSFALRESKGVPTWDQCRSFINRVSAYQFRTSKRTVNQAKRLAMAPVFEVVKELKEKALAKKTISPYRLPTISSSQSGIDYNVYFGYLHAHSELSDGEGTALEAYEFARDVGELDFFALTDHGVYLSMWPWQNRWQQLVEAAEATNQPGFAALYGFEWSNPVLGHINIINTPDFTNTITTFGITEIYDWLIQRPQGFGRFNHPGDYDFIRLELLHLKPYPAVVDQLVGIENYNGTDSFDQYYYSGSWWSFIPLSYWDVGNLRKWYLGSLGGQDNHSKHWGIRNEYRTAVLAEDLTRESIVDAYMSRRFYATEDKDLHLDFRCQGYPMGSRLENVSRDFEVRAWDESQDTFSEVRLYRNGVMINREILPEPQNVIELVFSDPLFSREAYYYVIVQQDDDNDQNGRNDEAICSPIWIK